MSGVSFPKAAHLRSRADFERVYAMKCKGADGTLLLFVSPNSLQETRIGLSVSRKHGGAVVRNHLKRLLREAFRFERSHLPSGLDLIAIPLAADKASLSAYRESISRLVRRLARRVNPSPPAESGQP